MKYGLGESMETLNTWGLAYTFSKKTDKVKEYRKLNDEGGYYYDPNTGEVRFNMTRPIKEYLPHYRGKHKDQVLSTW